MSMTEAIKKHFGAKTSSDVFADIDALQTACAEFARAQGWIMSADVRAARTNREMADLLDDVAVGNTADLDGRLGNILFVLACLSGKHYSGTQRIGT